MAIKTFNMCHFMGFIVCLLYETLAAKFAGVTSLAGMSHLMISSIRFAIEDFCAVATLELQGVCFLVLISMSRLRVPLITKFAFVRFFASVHQFMFLSVTGISKSLSTMLTFVRFLAGVYPLVLIVMTALSKSLLAKPTFMGLFTRVCQFMPI